MTAKRTAKAAPVEELDLDFENFSEFDTDELTNDEKTGLLLMPCYAVHVHLKEMGQVEDYDPKWSITYRVPFGQPVMQRLFAIAELIAQKTWKDEADEKFDAALAMIAQGVTPKKTNMYCLNGDLHLPNYNAGCWFIKASRREDEGRPAIQDANGDLIYDPINCIGGADEEIVGDVDSIVRPNDYCLALIRVWAQKSQDRINFTIEGVRLVKRGAGAQAANRKQRNAALSAMSSMNIGELPALPSGVVEEEAEEAEVVAVTAVSRRSTAPKKEKKGPSNKTPSVFRKRGKK